MPSWPLTIHLGSGAQGERRRHAYEARATKKGKSLSEWLCALADQDCALNQDKPKPNGDDQEMQEIERRWLSRAAEEGR